MGGAARELVSCYGAPIIWRSESSLWLAAANSVWAPLEFKYLAYTIIYVSTFSFRASFALSGILFSGLMSALCWAQPQTPLDKSLAPDREDAVSNVFREMGVVQRKAMQKSGKFLFSNYGALDFSDGPYSMYGFNTNLGYALSDFWEIYINAVPFFIANPRSIVDAVRRLEGGFDIGMVKPKYQLGGEILWAATYGKDSLGSTRVIRSDTFFKAGVMQIFYEGNRKGLKIHAGVGKTYFITKWSGFRFAATGNYVQTYRYSGKAGVAAGAAEFGFLAIVEAGLVFYL